MIKKSKCLNLKIFLRKYRNLIFSIIEIIALFLVCWYDQQLFYTLFIFAIIPKFGVFIMYVFCLVLVILDLKKYYSILNLISLILLIIPGTIILILFTNNQFKTCFTFDRYEKMRLEVVEMVKNNEIVPDEYNNAKLPEKYKSLSSDGKIYISQNDANGQVISFWVVRGFLSGSEELVYSSGEEKLIYENETGHPIKSIDKIKENWYYVITDY